MVSIEEYPFIFMNTPASLQVLASAEIALTIWRHGLANTSYWDAEARLCSWGTPLCEEVLDVPVPRSIQAQIDKKIVSIGKELKEWMDFHLDWKLFGNSPVENVNRLKHIVVDFSGSIGYKATTINILNSGEFNDAVNNYKISCTFCLEDQVKRFWPAVAKDPPTDGNSPYDRCFFSYWSGLMKVGNSITDTELVQLRMNKAKAHTNGVPLQRGGVTAFEYSLKMLPDDERIWKIIASLKHGVDQAVTRILSTLNRVQAEKVFKQQAYSIFRILMNNNCFQYAHQLWTLMGHLVLENRSVFSDVVFRLWKNAFYLDGVRLDYTLCDQINDLLLEIWSNASDELKAYVSDTFYRPADAFCLDESTDFPYEPDRSCKNNFANYYGHDMTFLLEIMSKLGNLDKEDWWERNWRALALRSKPLYLEQFMLMCLPNDDEIELFKLEIADFAYLFESLIEEGFYSDLKDYLLFCSRDVQHLQRFQLLGKKVLGSNLRFILIHDDDKFAKFDWFVGEVFANVKKDMDEFKSQMISSADECLKSLLAAYEADKISSKDFSKLITRFVENEEKLQLVKRKLFEHCREHPAETCFDADEWQEFLEWCTDADHEEISAFKRSLNVEMIFLERLSSYLNSKRFFKDLNLLDNFLNWYLGNEEEAKNFKLDKVKNYKQIDILRVEMEKRFIYPYSSLYVLLYWLFDGNDGNTREFLSLCS